jgi:hypothetical protein
MEGFFDRRWSHFGIRRDIATIAYQSGSANMQEKADQKVVWRKQGRITVRCTM